MVRYTTLATLSVLVLSGCMSTPVSAQNIYGNLRGDFSHSYSCGYRDSSYGYHHDSLRDYHHGHENYDEHGRSTYSTTFPIRHDAIPAFAGLGCPYENDAFGSEPFACPLKPDRVFQNQLNNGYQPSFGLGESNQNQSNNDDSHNGHSHDGHSHDDHFHNERSKDDSFAPSDRSLQTLPSLPFNSEIDSGQRPGTRPEQPRNKTGIRMDGPPPASFEPTSPSLPNNGNPKRIDVPPPPTL